MKIKIRNEKTIEISSIVLGGGILCDAARKEEYFNWIDHYLENGGNCIDTARCYCVWLPGGDGISEKIIGEYMQKRKNRDRIRISTKGGHPPLSDMHASRLTEEELTQDIESSLRDLRTDHVDIYFLHRDNPDADLLEVMSTLHGFVREGKTLALGASNFTVERIEEANAIALKNGLTPFTVSQIAWSPASTTPEKYGDTTLVVMDPHEYEGYKRTGIPVMAYSSQAKGFFSEDADLSSEKFKPYLDEENVKLRERIISSAKKRGIPSVRAALEIITENDIDASAIIGCSSLDQLKEVLNERNV